MKKRRYFLLLIGILSSCGSIGTTPGNENSITIEPSEVPTAEPTIEPTDVPIAEPTIEPTVEPTNIPSVEPTVEVSTSDTTSTMEPSDSEESSEPEIENTVESWKILFLIDDLAILISKSFISIRLMFTY